MSALTAHPSTTKASALQVATQDIKYLIDPKKNSPAAHTRRTRYFLRTARYVAKFLFWRLIRYIKYAAVGAATAAIAGTAIGSVLSGAAFVIAPPGIFAGAGVGLLWGLGKFGWRTLARRVRKGDVEHADPKKDEKHEGHEEVEAVRPPSTDPW